MNDDPFIPDCIREDKGAQQPRREDRSFIFSYRLILNRVSTLICVRSGEMVLARGFSLCEGLLRNVMTENRTLHDNTVNERIQLL